MIRRVSSRQRLVSWDAFDATANHAEATSSSSEEEDYNCSESSPTTISRKRDRSCKTKSSTTTVVQQSVGVLNAASSSAPHSAAAALNNNNIPAFPWEFASFKPQPIDELPEEVFVYACTFLDNSSLGNILQLNHKFRQLLLSADSLWMTKCQQLWKGLLPSSQDANIQLQDSTSIPTVVPGPHCTMTANLPLLISMTPNHLPTKVDESMLGKCRRVHRTFQRTPHNNRLRILERQLTPEDQQEELIAFESNGRRSIQYTGRVGAGDRCIRSNHPLPRPTRRSTVKPNHSSIFDMLCRSSSSNAIQGGSCLNVWRPFVAPYMAQNNSKSLQVGPRMVAYFEVSILEHARPDIANSQSPKRDCVAVGVATESFSCQTRMPGWDSQSFGYHGDDGGTFHASGAMLERFGPCFGAGDVVGCGIDYVARGIFFTLNGNFLGYGWKQIDAEFLDHDLYGVVGIDTNDPVTVNYGSQPFLFNLNRFTRPHDKLIAHQYQHSTKQVEEDSELADLPSYPEI